jgi:hypothetical protein
MDVQRLKTLANVVEQGVVEFPEMGLNVAFNMEVTFSAQTGWYVPITRIDIPDWKKVNACCCLLGFTMILYSPLKHDFLRGNMELSTFHEGMQELQLDRKTGLALFYGTLDRWITGEGAARVVRKLILTEQVDWSIARQ